MIGHDELHLQTRPRWDRNTAVAEHDDTVIRSHQNKRRHWVVNKYFGKFNPSRQDRWVFGDRDSGIYLRQFVWTKIVRHRLVMGTASPGDPTLDQYWADRRRKTCSLLGGITASLLLRQHGLCPRCDTFLLHADHGLQRPQERASGPAPHASIP